MQNKTTSLHSTFSVKNEIISEDTRFLPIVVDVMHLGENLNGSYFEKEVVDSCIDSIKNTPILGFVKQDEVVDIDDFAGHEYAIQRTDNGIEEIYVGHAYGVIPESCNPRWVIKVCDDGIEREFLRVDALLWEKFSNASNIIKRDNEKAQSMELAVESIEGYDDENYIFHFTSFKFDGACILGDGVQPAMIGANVRINDGTNFSIGDITDDIRRELNDKFELFNATFTSLVNDKSNQGGVKDMDLEQIVETQPVESEQEAVEFEAVETEVVETSEKVEVKTEETVDAEPEFTETETEIVDIEANYQKVKADYDDMLVAFNQLKSDYETIKAEYETIKPKYDEYVQAEAQRAEDELNAQKDAKFSEYEEFLGDNAEFQALKEKKGEMSVDDIEKECAVMYVKASRANQFSFSKTGSTSAVVGVFEDDSDSGEYINTKYGPIRKTR